MHIMTATEVERRNEEGYAKLNKQINEALKDVPPMLRPLFIYKSFNMVWNELNKEADLCDSKTKEQ